ncbi:response regulator transcription factor [Pantoea dispersa]|uniref:response regulator transcription factor n=1 Tax=Pantoea dispersa TaxID=59814 RepID=UPI0013313FAD|nr:response regulator transcription factor [Pantoea dispersa]
MITNVTILDDHPLFSAGLKTIINRDPLLVVRDVCKTSVELFFSLTFGSTDILLIDCSRPAGETDAHDLVKQLHNEFPDIALILMGENAFHRQIAEQCPGMIKDYLCKTLSPECYLLGLHRVREKLDSETKISAAPLSSERLSAKEKSILEYLHSGMSVTETAARVNRSVKTISTQKRNAMRKLGIKRNRDIYQLSINEL